MKKILITALLTGLFHHAALAQGGAAENTMAATPASTFNGTIGLFSDYRFRGISQTFMRPALQGGIDYTHSSGWYAGNWNSNVSPGAGYPGSNLEMDFYAGYKTDIGAIKLDLGALYYAYPGAELNGKKVKNGELYLGASWKFLSARYSHALTDYFNARGPNGERTRGTGYLDLSAAFDLGEGWGIHAHVGRLRVHNLPQASYTDWKLGISKELHGWVLGLSYIDSNAAGACRHNEPYCLSNDLDRHGQQTGAKRRDAGRSSAVVSISRNF
ncbi:TorF family putative porin [Azonexus sp.]|uniref:TorF family putative porin n=1 Tax=Azonexus sp. TaxID=1872668 RepID=UPI0039E42465